MEEEEVSKEEKKKVEGEEWKDRRKGRKKKKFVTSCVGDNFDFALHDLFHEGLPHCVYKFFYVPSFSHTSSQTTSSLPRREWEGRVKIAFVKNLNDESVERGVVK